MTNKRLIIYISSILAVLIPCPGRLASGIILAVSFDITFILTTMLNFLFFKLNLHKSVKVLLPLSVVSLVTVFKLILMLISPLNALQLSFIFYLQAFSIYVIFLNSSETENLDFKLSLKKMLVNCLWFTGFILGFSLLRDVLGYGTLSFPVTSGINQIKLFDINSCTFLNFFASTPGAAIISAVIISLAFQINNRKSTSEVNDE